MTLNDVFLRSAKGFNTVVMAAMKAPVVGKFARRFAAQITYVGRKTGRTISLVVAYRRSGDTVTIAVGMPDRKKWWRNFLGEGAPMTLLLGDEERTGHAVAHRDERGGVEVTVQLDPA